MYAVRSTEYTRYTGHDRGGNRTLQRMQLWLRRRSHYVFTAWETADERTCTQPSVHHCHQPLNLLMKSTQSSGGHIVGNCFCCSCPISHNNAHRQAGCNYLQRLASYSVYSLCLPRPFDALFWKRNICFFHVCVFTVKAKLLILTYY